MRPYPLKINGGSPQTKKKVRDLAEEKEEGKNTGKRKKRSARTKRGANKQRFWM